MNNRYVIKFSKNGYVKYTSHLDLLRMFKRIFKCTNLGLSYSQGFNPHPKMSFAQPLSLGYSSDCELIEFELTSPCEPVEIINRMQPKMPEGITLLKCSKLPNEIKSLAADADSAYYKIWIPTEMSADELKKVLDCYLSQDEIVTLKRQKKTKKLAPVNIKSKIRECKLSKLGEFALIETTLDCGSASNCSPELVIASFCEFAGIDTPRHEMEVERKALYFSSGFSI